jgi:DNA-binding FadR family transcriptional regulator
LQRCCSQYAESGSPWYSVLPFQGERRRSRGESERFDGASWFVCCYEEIAVSLSPVRAGTGRLSEAVLAQFEGLIASGEWAVGSKIPSEPELVTALGVGRNTIREAVRALEHAGLLEPRRGDGTYVRAARVSLEPAATAVAATSRIEADVRAIQTAVVALREASECGGRAAFVSAFVSADLAFRRAVLAATKSDVVSDLYAGLAEVLRQGAAGGDDLGNDPSGASEYGEATPVLAVPDPVAVRAAVDSYLDAVRKLVDHVAGEQQR